MSWYLTIRSDGSYSKYTDAERLVEFLRAMPELRQSTPVSFESAIDSPWVSVILASCDSVGSYSADIRLPQHINVVELVCSYDGDTVWYESVAIRIAMFVGWCVYEDHEKRVVWSPASPPPHS